MEQAVNQFTKGLQVDTNPMVQGDDTLSDALNATFVTMNGNEVILQNDMGNRRVDHAFLPAGYEPVGIKEYGGVIYVASYNPITNRSQIGSFPSPERIQSSLDNPDLGIESYAFSRFFKESNIENIGGILFLKNDEFMDQLTADTSLHAGDKFSIYSDYIWKKEDQEYINQKYISHFNNWDGQKQISPKNKLFTLSVGVMNSQNEFVDITESLERFNEDNELIKIENDAQKQDDGYFIAPTKPTTKKEDIYIERNLLAVNTYSYKLVGPLQLKTTLNHIQNFDFVMDWQKGSEENQYILIIRGIATYNCPDVLITNKQTEIETEGDSEIIVEGEVEIEDSDPTIPSERKEYAKRARFDILQNTQQTIEKAFESFDVYIKNSTKIKWAKLDNSETKTILPDIKTTYDINTDLYTSTITKKYTFTGSEAYDNILQYYICVKALAEPYEEKGEEYNDIYLKNLSYQGEVDLTKIGSNIVELKEYRYWYEPLDTNEGLATMTFFTEAYPDHFTEFSDFKIQLEQLGDSSWDPDSYLYEAGTVQSGRVTFSFPTTQAQTLYRVKFSYNKKSTIEEGQEEPITIYRYLLTTELFNNCYYGSSGDYVGDYGLFMGTISEGSVPYTITYNNQPILTGVSEDQKKIRDKYLEVKLKLDGNIINKTATPTQNTEGTFIRPKGTEEEPFGDISYRTTYFTTLDLIYNYEVAINNQENYPTYIKLDSVNTQITSIGTPRIDYAIEFVDQRIEGKGEKANKIIAEVKSLSDSSSQKEYLAKVGNVSGENFEVTQNIKYYDIFEAGAIASTEKTFGTLYVDLNNADIMKQRLIGDWYSGFEVGSYGDSNHNFYTYIKKAGPVNTYEDYDKELFAQSSTEDLGGFIDVDQNYRMYSALQTVINRNGEEVNFIYLVVGVTKQDKSYGYPYPVYDQYFINKADSKNDDDINEGLPSHTITVTRYYLDYYTMVLWKDNREGKLYQLGMYPFRYRDRYSKTEGTNSYKDVYDPINPTFFPRTSGAASRLIRRAEYFWDDQKNSHDSTLYEGRSDAVIDSFYQNILDFIGITQDGEDTYSYVVPISNYLPPEDSLIFPTNNDYCYNHTYKLIGNVQPAEVKVTAELKTNEKGNNLLKLELKDADTSKAYKQVTLETESVEIVLNTDPTFEESCNSILYDDQLNDMYLKTGEKVPKPGENKTYVSKNDGKLILVNNPPFIYSMENSSISFKNRNKQALQESEYYLKCLPHNEGGDKPGSGRTILPFRQIQVVTKEMLEYHAGD